jgi:hypothetical protein
MPRKKDQDSTPGAKLLRLFRRLMFDGNRHYQTELADWLKCSPQTIIRLIQEIESIVGLNLETGMDCHRRWYQMKSSAGGRLGMEFEEVRYLSLCRDLANNVLPMEVLERIDKTLFNLSLMVTEENSVVDQKRSKQLIFFNKGYIDYNPFREIIERLLYAQENRVICTIKYKASGRFLEDTREHIFAPGKLISLSNALYVVGASLKEDNTFKYWTNLAIHRVMQLSLTDSMFNFEIPLPDPNTFGFPFHAPKTFRIRFRPGSPADYVRERIWAEEQSMTEEKDGALILTITTRSELELMSWVRSFGEECEILND